jgi:hypothetical protein
MAIQTENIGTTLKETVEGQGLPPTVVARPGKTGTPTEAEVAAAKTRATAIQEKSDAKNETRNRREEAKSAKRAEVEAAARAELERLHKEGDAHTYPNPYYAGPQIALFIGDRWVGDGVTVTWTETSNKTPLYGYASSHFDAVAKGTILVQGQLSIAYTSPDYLYEILSRYSESEGRQSMFPTDINDPIEKAKKLFWNLQDTTTNLVGRRPLEYGFEDGFAGQIRRGFDIRIFFGAQEFIRDSITTWGKGIDIKVGGHIREIRDVHLTSCSTTVTPSGEPIAETYSFFAKSSNTTAFNLPGTRTVSVPTNASTGLVPIAGVNGSTSVNQKYIRNLKGR